MTYSIDTVASLLAYHQSDALARTAGTSAAVAMILRQGACCGLELLYIQRSTNEHDPWSGNLAFPGGKVERGESPREAAERETAEEVGLDLRRGRYLGQMPAVRGSYLPVQVSCFVYWMNGTPVELTLNDGEVRDTYWADLNELDNRECHLVAPVRFGGEEFEAPAIRLAWPGSPVLWGLTYRLTMQFLEMYRNGVAEDGAIAFSPGIGTL